MTATLTPATKRWIDDYIGKAVAKLDRRIVAKRAEAARRAEADQRVLRGLRARLERVERNATVPPSPRERNRNRRRESEEDAIDELRRRADEEPDSFLAKGYAQLADERERELAIEEVERADPMLAAELRERNIE
jgi:hypothetical protein